MTAGGSPILSKGITVAYKILTISDDDGLRASRDMVLRSEGYDVQSQSSQAFLEIARGRSCNLAILCQSVPADRATSIAEQLRHQNPAIRILRMNPFRACSEPRFNTDFEVFAGPYALLRAIEGLLCNKPLPTSPLPALQL